MTAITCDKHLTIGSAGLKLQMSSAGKWRNLHARPHRITSPFLSASYVPGEIELTHLQIESTSAVVNLARGCASTYSSVGISWSVTSLQISGSTSCCFSGVSDFQSEKFIAPRPLLTSLTTSHDAGATLLYHGQTVRFEWQSLQARVNAEATAGYTLNAACIVRDGSTGGFVLAGGKNCVMSNTRRIK